MKSHACIKEHHVVRDLSLDSQNSTLYNEEAEDIIMGEVAAMLNSNLGFTENLPYGTQYLAPEFKISIQMTISKYRKFPNGHSLGAPDW